MFLWNRIWILRDSFSYSCGCSCHPSKVSFYSEGKEQAIANSIVNSSVLSKSCVAISFTV